MTEQQKLEYEEWLKNYELPATEKGKEIKCALCGSTFVTCKSYVRKAYSVCKKCKNSFTSSHKVYDEQTKASIKEKLNASWNARSEEEKASIVAKRSKAIHQTALNRTEEEKKALGEKLSQLQLNFSEEKKKEIADRKRLEFANRDPEKEKARLEKIKETKDSWSEEFKQDIINRTKETRKNWTEDQRENWIESAKATRRAWTLEFRKELSEKHKAYWKGIPEQKRKDHILKLSQGRAKWFANLTDEQRIELRSKSVKKYKYQGVMFDSSWELAFWIYAKDHNWDIERETVVLTYMFEGKEHHYFPDFVCNGELVEVKGDHFFKKGEMYCPFDPRLNALYEAKHQCIVSNNVKLYDREMLKDILSFVDSKYGKII